MTGPFAALRRLDWREAVGRAVALGAVVAWCAFMAQACQPPLPPRAPDATPGAGATVERARSITQVEAPGATHRLYRVVYANGDTCYIPQQIVLGSSWSMAPSCFPAPSPTAARP